MNARFPSLVTARMTPFGDDGPWQDFKSSDLIHLALGGIMMNCGYDPDPNLEYDTPPIAPQIWHAYHIAGEQLATGIIAALIHRHRSGQGQDVSVAVHEAVSKNPELDIMHWVMRRVPIWRMTNRHAAETPNHSPSISHTKDGRWFISHGMGARDLKNLVPLLSKYGMQADLQPPPPDADLRARQVPGSQAGDETRAHMLDVVQRFIRAWTYADMPWREAQDAGLLWAPLRKPHENALDEHWLKRKSFADVFHPEHGRSFRYPSSKWLSTRTSWQVGRRAPLLGEDTVAVLGEAMRRPSVPAEPRGVANAKLSALHNKPFPLQGVKILDFAWFLASAGGTRFLAAMGAESYKVEWKDNPDTRLAAMAPIGGRAARDAATGPLPGVKDPDMGGQFNNKNAGKRGISLNIRHPKGLQIAKDLVRICDVVAEGFSPGVLQRLGLGYDVMKSIRPDIIYIQQSGMGVHGTYGRMRTVGSGCGGVWRAGRHVGVAGAGDAGRLGLLVSRLDGRLRLRAGAARRAVSSRAYRRGAVDRRVAMRIRIVPDRRYDSRLVGERAGMATLRQSLALQAGGAAWRVSLRGQGSLDRHRLLHRCGVARTGAGGRAGGVAGRSPLQHAGTPAAASGFARCARGVVDAHAGPL